MKTIEEKLEQLRKDYINPPEGRSKFAIELQAKVLKKALAMREAQSIFKKDLKA